MKIARMLCGPLALPTLVDARTPMDDSGNRPKRITLNSGTKQGSDRRVARFQALDIDVWFMAGFANWPPVPRLVPASEASRKPSRASTVSLS